MKKHFLLLVLIGASAMSLVSCSSSLSNEKIYEIYTAPLTTDVEFVDQETNYSNSYFKTQPIKIYLRLFENGIANGVIESDMKVYSVSGEYSYMEATKVTNETYIISLESNRKSFSITIDNDTKDVRSTLKSGVFQRLNTTITESELDIEAFNNMYEQGSSSEFFPLEFFGGYVYSEVVSDYWLGYFGYQDVVNKRIKDREEERLRLAAEEERKNKIKKDRQREADRLTRICSSIKNYDVKQFITYVPDVDMKYIENARRGARGEKVEGQRSPIRTGFLPKMKYKTGFIYDKGVVITEDGTPYTGPFTETYKDELYAGDYALHGYFIKLKLLPNQSIEKYIARCD